MATKKATETANAAQNEAVVNSSAEAEKNVASGENKAGKAEDGAIYTAAEFVKAAETAFERPYSPDIVRAALRMAGVTQTTKTEAAEIIKKFLGEDKEVAEA